MITENNIDSSAITLENEHTVAKYMSTTMQLQAILKLFSAQMEDESVSEIICFDTVSTLAKKDTIHI